MWRDRLPHLPEGYPRMEAGIAFEVETKRKLLAFIKGLGVEII
jgi:hypothetical protein